MALIDVAAVRPPVALSVIAPVAVKVSALLAVSWLPNTREPPVMLRPMFSAFRTTCRFKSVLLDRLKSPEAVVKLPRDAS